jgi:hypothetical protein
VEDPLDLVDVLVEEAEGRRVRQHQPRRRLVDLGAEVVEVDIAARVGLDADEFIARHRHRGRVRPVGGVGDDDAAPLLALAALLEVRAHEHQACDLALRAGGRLERDAVESGDLGQDLLEPPHELEGALRAALFLERVQVAEARQSDDALVDARVVLHRAGAQRVEAGVDAEVLGRELGEVAQELRLGQLGQARRLIAGELSRDLGGRQVGPRDPRGAAPGLRALVDQLHAPSTSARRSMSSGVRRSVTATSSASSIPS